MFLYLCDNIGTMEEGSNSVSNGQVDPDEQLLDDDDVYILIGWLCIIAEDMSMHMREPIRDNKLSGPEWIREIVYGHSDRCYEAFRMERHVFLNLCELMRAKG